jgi:sugar lactone lactonase YvrE
MATTFSPRSSGSPAHSPYGSRARLRTRRRRSFVAAGVLAVVGLVPLVIDGARADADSRDPNRRIELPEAVAGVPGSSAPEGVAYGGGRIYVSSRTSGAIFVAKPKDDRAEVFLAPGMDGRTAATGMKVANGRLFVSGAGTGKVFVYKTNGDLEFSATVADPATGPTFVNDVAIGPDGSAYFTDSFRPVLYRVHRESGEWRSEVFLSFTGTVLTYAAGFNVNGIVVRPDGTSALVVSRRSLYRIDLATKAVSAVAPAGGVPGDGLLLTDSGDLLAVGGGENTLRRYSLSPDWSLATLVATAADPSFRSATTVATKGDEAFVVNAQFAAPVPPYDVSVLPIP